MRVARDPVAHAQNHPAVPPHQRLERRLIPPAEVAVEQRVVRGPVGGLPADDAGKSRYERLREVLQQAEAALADLAEKVTIKVYAFDADLKELTFVGGRVTLHWSPNPGDERHNGLPAEMRGCKIWWHTGAGAAQNNWNWLADDTASPYVHIPTGINLPETLWYRVQYFDRRMNLGRSRLLNR